MNSIIVTPYIIRNYCSNTGCTLRKDYILVGADRESDVYKCKLFFNTMSLGTESIIKKATLRMFCNTRRTSSTHTLIYAQLVGVKSFVCAQTSIKDTGWYEWDVTEMMNAFRTLTQFSICLFTECNQYRYAKTFCNQSSVHPVSLEIITHQDKETSTYEYKEDCLSSDHWRYSKWINCSVYKNYVYHIYNAGKTDVEVILNISPNEDYCAESSPMYTVKPESLIVVDPWKYSFYIRVAFKNTAECTDNLIKLWFQALK